MSEKPVIYIGGPIADVDNYKKQFQLAEDHLTSQGWEVRNPCKIQGHISWPSERWLRSAIRLMLTCDCAAFLPGWYNSRGSFVERRLAEEVGMPLHWITSLEPFSMERYRYGVSAYGLSAHFLVPSG